MISLIIALVVLGVLWYLIKLIPLPAPIPRIIDILFVLVAVATVVSVLFGVQLPFPKLK